MSSQFEFKDDNVKELPKNVTKEKKSSPSKIKTSKRVKAIPCTPQKVDDEYEEEVKPKENYKK